MKDLQDERSKEEFLLRMKDEKSKKQYLLDEHFKRAELLRDKQKNLSKTPQKKPFFKSGLIFIIISIIVLGLIFQLPWMYVKYESIDYGEVNVYINRDFEVTKNYPGEKLSQDQIYPEIKVLFSDFGCDNCSNYTRNYFGIISEDFTSIPNMISNGFIGLILFGLIFTLFELIDRKKNFSVEISHINHSFFASASLIASIIIFFNSMKFIGAYFMFFHNSAFISALGIKNVTIFFIVPIILIILSAILIRICLAVLIYNFKDLVSRNSISKMDKKYLGMKN